MGTYKPEDTQRMGSVCDGEKVRSSRRSDEDVFQVEAFYLLFPSPSKLIMHAYSISSVM